MSFSPDDQPQHGRTDRLILVAAVLLGIAVGQLAPDSRLAVNRTLRGTVLAPFLAAHATFARHARLDERLARVRTERDSLARLLQDHRSVVAENRELRRLLDMEEGASGGYRAVTLLPGRARSGAARTFWMEAGRAEGVRPPVGVTTVEGVVGIVRAADAHRSTGDFWTHPDFRVSVRTPAGEASGIVHPSYESGQPVLLLEGAPYQAEVPSGTPLVTSGLGGVFPEGVPVGRVRELVSVEAGWKKSYRVEPAVRPETVGAGLVWLRPPRER